MTLGAFEPFGSEGVTSIHLGRRRHSLPAQQCERVRGYHRLTRDLRKHLIFAPLKLQALCAGAAEDKHHRVMPSRTGKGREAIVHLLYHPDGSAQALRDHADPVVAGLEIETTSPRGISAPFNTLI